LWEIHNIGKVVSKKKKEGLRKKRKEKEGDPRRKGARCKHPEQLCF
jgi:hypothetical protein